MTDVVATLRESLGAAVLTDPEVLSAHRRDYWVRNELADLRNEGPALPLAVVEPTSTQQVSQVLATCRAARVAVVTRGGGSGVCGGVEAQGNEVVLSTRRMDGQVELDTTDLTASFRAGTNGLAAEQQLQEHGLSMGHWPQSIELASVGGLVATRSAGQFSTAYGNVEDILLDLEVVLPDGSVLRTPRIPRAAAGPDLRQLFLGSEGTLGVITEATFSLRKLPEARVGQAFHFASFDAGLDAIRACVQAGWLPPVVRLYDAAESNRSFSEYCPEGRSLLILLHEGSKPAMDVQCEAVVKLCRASGGDETDSKAVEDWLDHRNRVPGFRGFLEKGIILDTIEVSASWTKVAALYQRALASLAEVPDLLVASAHSSHSYRSGTNLYFTFVARPAQPEQMLERYNDCWRRVIDATLACGGGIAHHHGIGRVRRERLAEELGSAGVALLRSVKRALDPDGLLNPGVLIPDGD